MSSSFRTRSPSTITTVMVSNVSPTISAALAYFIIKSRAKRLSSSISSIPSSAIFSRKSSSTSPMAPLTSIRVSVDKNPIEQRSSATVVNALWMRDWRKSDMDTVPSRISGSSVCASRRMLAPRRTVALLLLLYRFRDDLLGYAQHRGYLLRPQPRLCRAPYLGLQSAPALRQVRIVPAALGALHFICIPRYVLREHRATL